MKAKGPPVIVVHHLAHAQAALGVAAARGVAVRLESAANAAAQGGALWFACVIEAAARAHPEARFEAVLDCGQAAGRALGAIREFSERNVPLAIRTAAPARARAKIAAIGKAARVRVHEGVRGKALDLLDAPDPGAAVRASLGGSAEGPGGTARKTRNRHKSRASSRLQKA